jgi:hypothetical protein
MIWLCFISSTLPILIIISPGIVNSAPMASELNEPAPLMRRAERSRYLFWPESNVIERHGERTRVGAAGQHIGGRYGVAIDEPERIDTGR